MADLTDEQCDAFRRPPGSFNDMVRAIYRAGMNAATPPADAALADDALCESLIEASDMRWNGDVYIGDGADLMNLVRAALRARAVPAAAVRSEPFLNFNLTQAMALVESFGGLDGDMAVSWFAKANDAETGEPMPEGLYAYCYDYPEEGRTWLGDPMAEIAHAPAAKPVAVPDDAVRAELHGILEYVEGEMQSAYHNAYPECCGRGRGGECCGSPEPAWSKEDQAIMDKLAPVQSRLHAMLAASKAAEGNV